MGRFYVGMVRKKNIMRVLRFWRAGWYNVRRFHACVAVGRIGRFVALGW